MIRRTGMNLVPTPDFVRLNVARVHEGYHALASDDALNATLQAGGYVKCFEKPYVFAPHEGPWRIQTPAEIEALLRPPPPVEPARPHRSLVRRLARPGP